MPQINKGEGGIEETTEGRENRKEEGIQEPEVLLVEYASV